MARDKLTDLKVRSFNKLGRYGDGSGLWLQVRGSKNKSWLFRYTLDGRQRQMGLGSYPDVALAAARLAATAARQAVFAGEDPIAAKRAQRSARSAAAALTFRAVAEMYVTAHEPTWRNQKHRWQWRATLENHVYPVFGDWQVKTIDTGAVMKVLEPIWHTKPETAARVRGRIETVLDYASARAWRNGDNPARWRGHIANLLPAKGQGSSG